MNYAGGYNYDAQVPKMERFLKLVILKNMNLGKFEVASKIEKRWNKLRTKNLQAAGNLPKED